MTGVALTFDDGPHPAWTPAVLDALEAQSLRASFFVVGSCAARRPELVAAVRAAGHAVELHCHEHVRHAELGLNALDEDARDALAVLGELGVRPRRWRPPGGEPAPWSHLVARAHDLELVGWTADTQDWRGEEAGAMLAALDRRLRPGACVRLHDGLGPGAQRSGCAQTVELVQRLGPVLRERGLAETAAATGRHGR